MGYSTHYFESHIAVWLQERWLPRPGSMLDFGAQAFVGDQTRTRESVGRFLADHHLPRDAHSIREIYRLLGIEYHTIDVLGGDTYVDLNIDDVPDELRGRFDFVNNEGTIEHLVNPINGFRFAHDAAKVGGVIRHCMPISGHYQHGLFYPTPKFYEFLFKVNRYERLSGWIETVDYADRYDGGFFTETRMHTKLPGFNAFPTVNQSIHLLYRKTSSKDFVIPADIQDDVSGKAERKVARAYATHKSRPSWFRRLFMS